MVEIVSENDSKERRKLPGMLQTVANKCVTLTTSEPLATSTAVGIEYNDVLFVGEVIRCTQGAADQWEISVKIAHTLTSLQSLMILRAELEQHQTRSKDAPMEELTPCAVLGAGKKKPAKNHPEQ
jgi:hypothetical protein